MRPFLPTLLLTVVVGFCSCPVQAQWAVQDQSGTPINNSSGPYVLYANASGHATNTYPSNMLDDVQAGRASSDYLSCFNPNPGYQYANYPYVGPAWADGLMTGGSYNLYASVAAYNAAYFNGSPVGFYKGTPLTGSIKQDMTAPLFATFLWSPPSDPPPSLGVLITNTLSAHVQEFYPSSGPTTGLSGNVTSSVYFGSVGDTLIASSSTVSSLSLVGRHTLVLPVASRAATLVGQSQVVSSANNPIPYSVPGQNGQPATVNGGAGVYSDGVASVTVSPIIISAPNPLGRPDLGDGTNQSVYGAQQPDGYLYVPGALRAVGASSADMQWLLANNTVDMAIDNSVIPNTFVHGWTVSGDTLFINTTNNGYPNYKFNSWIFKGLPSQNSSFGNHDVNLYVQNTKAQTAKIQTFYSATASNYPQSPDDYAINNYYIPNWFNYYEQAYPNSTSYDPNMTGPEGETDPTAAGMAWVAGPPDGKGGVKIEVEVTKMGPMAVTASSVRNIPVFEISPMTNYLDVAGQLQIKGIYSYLYVDGHETTHIAMYVSGDVIPRNSDGTLPQGIVDSDGDFIPDQIESKYHLNPRDSDTTGYFTDASNFPEGSYTNRGDEEAIAAIGGLHAVVSNSTAWQQDWADISVQYGARPTYFPYEFVPTNAAAPHTNSVPSSAVTVLP